MKLALATLAATAVLALAPAAFAADDSPSYENGPVWTFSKVQTKDGHFDDYMKWLSTQWKAQEEALKKAGVITDYKVYVVNDARGDEPDIILAEQYKNMAVFDRPVSEVYALQAKIFGSMPKANQEQAARGSIRTLQGQTTMREVVLK